MQSKNNQSNWRMFRGLVVASIAAACYLPRAEARTVTWTGGGDGSTWSDGRNWDGTAHGERADDIARRQRGAFRIAFRSACLEQRNHILEFVHPKYSCSFAR